MRRPFAQLSVIGIVRIGRGDKQDAPLPRRLHQPAEIRDDLFRSGHVELTARQHEVCLGIDFPEDRLSGDHVLPLSGARRLHASLPHLLEQFFETRAVMHRERLLRGLERHDALWQAFP